MRGFDRGFERGAEAWFGGSLWLIGMVLTILLIAAIVGGIVWVATRNRPRTLPVATIGAVDDPLRLAAARYAAGEIDREQFEQVRAALSDLATRTTEPPTSV